MWVAQRRHTGLNIVHTLQNTLCHRQKFLAETCECNTLAAISHKKRHSELMLKAAYGIAQRRLRDVQLLCCLCKVQNLRNFDKI